MEPSTLLITEITEYLSQLNREQQQAVLTVVKSLAVKQDDWWDEISVTQQQKIDDALTEMKEGKLTKHEEVMKKYSKWQ